MSTGRLAKVLFSRLAFPRSMSWFWPVLWVFVATCACSPEASRDEEPSTIEGSSLLAPEDYETLLKTETAAVLLQGRYIYFGRGEDLVILERSEENEFSLLGELTLASPPLGFALRDSLLAVAAGTAGAYVIDVSDPAHPKILFHELLSDRVEAAAFGEDRLFFAAGAGGVHSLDLRVPGEFSMFPPFRTEEQVVDLEKVGDWLVLASTYAGMKMLDVSDPQAVKETGFADRGSYDLGSAWSICATERYAYVANVEIGLRVVDISDPYAPTTLALYPLLHAPVAVALAGEGFLLFADQDQGLKIVDVRKPREPREVGRLRVPGRVVDVDVDGGLAVLALETGGIRLVDVSDPTQPLEVGSYLVGRDVSRLRLRGSRLAVIDRARGGEVWEVDDPRAPELLFRTSQEPAAVSLEVSSTDLYLGSENGLTVFDYSTSEKARGRHLEVAGEILELWLEGEVLWMAVGRSGIRIVELSERGDPTWRDHIPVDRLLGEARPNEVGFASPAFLKAAWSFVRWGDWNLVGLDRGLSRFRWSEEESAQSLSFLSLPERVVRIEPGSGVVYLGCDDGVQIVSTRDPERLVPLSRVPTRSFVRGVWEREKMLYVADLSGELLCVDVGDPASPEVRARIQLPGRIEDLQGTEDVLYLALGPLGFWSFDVGDPTKLLLLYRPERFRATGDRGPSPDSP